MNLNLNSLIPSSASIKNVYLMGSRLWGTATDDSDYDLLIVAENYTGPISVHGPNIDGTVLTPNEFRERLKQHEFLETIAIHAPNENRLKEQIKINPPKFDLELWNQVIHHRMTRDLAYADKNEAKGKLERASKTRFHALSTLIMAIEFIKFKQNDQALDFTEIKKYKDILWTGELFEPVYQKLLLSL